jgi:hypothetical protein
MRHSLGESKDSAEDWKLIRLQALRIDLEPPRNSLPASLFHELALQRTGDPRLWVSPFEFITVEDGTGVYRLSSERGGFSRTLFAAPNRCEMTRHLYRAGKPLRLLSVPDKVIPPAWPGFLFAWIIGLLCGASLVLALVKGLITFPF